jgi:NTE family protein
MALSGGGVLGAAHLGVLAELSSMGLWPHVLSGTSAGGLVAACLAGGASVEQLIQVGREVTRHPSRYFEPEVLRLAMELVPRDPLPPALGLFRPVGFLRALLALIPRARSLEELTLPTALVAVDLRSMQAVAFVGGLGPGPQVAPPPDTAVPLPLGGWQVVTQAPVALAMASTMAQPGLFTAVDHPPWLLVDGGAADTLPVDWAFHLGADRVVAVNVTKVGPLPPRVGITTILSRSEAYTTQTLSQLRIPPHRRVLLLEPDTSHVPFPGLSSYPRLLQAGRRVVVENAQRLRAFLQDASPQGPDR